MTATKNGNLLFICTGNACRSPLAEAIARAKLKGRQIESAGVRPFGVHPLTVKILEENDISPEGLSSKPVTDELLGSAEKIIVLCKSAYLILKPKLRNRKFEFWDIKDPLVSGINEGELRERFRETYDILKDKISKL